MLQSATSHIGGVLQRLLQSVPWSKSAMGANSRVSEGGPYEPESEEDLPPGNLVPAGVLALKTETEPNDQIGDANEISVCLSGGSERPDHSCR